MENEKLKEKLLLTNVKNPKNSQYYELVITQLTNRCQERNKEFDFNVNQTKEKFKRCVSLCREAALKIKTGSGIKRFQEEKQYGSWFSSLFAIVQSMDSCQPEQSLEPDFSSSSRSGETSESTPVNGKRKLFVPVHETHKNKKASKRRDEKLQDSLNKITEILNNDRTNELIDLMKQDSQKQQEQMINL